MKTIEWTTASSANALLEQARREEIVVTRDGKPVAIVTPVDPGDIDFFAKERDPDFIDSIAKARADVAAGRGVSHEDLQRELDLER